MQKFLEKINGDNERGQKNKPFAEVESRINMGEDLLTPPSNLPVPIDTGECNHLQGLEIPSASLLTTKDRTINISELKNAIIFVYPMTGRPDRVLPENWDTIPGARGCTPQACSFRDNLKELKQLGMEVFGLSVQSSEYQKEAVSRLHLNYELISDEKFVLQQGLGLPVFEADGKKLLKRVTLIIKNGVIIKYFFPVFPTDKNIFEVLAFLKESL